MTVLDADDMVAESGGSNLDLSADNSKDGSDLEIGTIQLEEHDSTEDFGPLRLSKKDREFIEGMGDNSTPLSLKHTSEGRSYISSSSYVGVASLPSGLRIEVNPKETVSRLLDLLQYSMDVPTDTIETETGLKKANKFIDAFASLYHAELKQVLRQGIRRDYKRVQGIEESVRGRLEVQRQIQRPNPIPTDFAVEYDTFTANTKLNQAVLLATQILTILVRDEELSGRLSRQETQLRKLVSPEHVSVEELQNIEITRLNEHYEDLLELTQIVLSRRFFEDIKLGQRESFGLFINMNSIFESVVERAFKEAARDEWSVEGQGDISNLIEGPHSVSMTPDFVVKDSDGEVLLVGDAKWKTGSTSPGDIYQITSYMMADDAPGILVYPEKGTEEAGASQVQKSEGELSLRSVNLPTAAEVDSYEEYRREIVEAAKDCISDSVMDPDSIAP
jgi:5-methylcytosine-specific restriction enzyme subunit McrC